MDSSSEPPAPAAHRPCHEKAQQQLLQRRYKRSSVPQISLTLLLASPSTTHARNLALINQNPFLPDYVNNLCKNDKPADSWMTAVPVTAEACCKLHFSWNLEACARNSREWALENGLSSTDQKDEEEVVYTKYWADTTEGICKLDGPDRPSWTEAYDIPYEKCCSDHLSWNYYKCMAHEPEDDEDEMAQNSSSTGKKYYPDSIKGYCKEDGPGRPSWISIIEDDYITCCENHFDESDQMLKKCLEKMPKDATTAKPTGKPSKSPVTPAPVPDLYFTPAPEATNPTTSPPSTLRPTPLPTSNVVCSDQSLSKSQCESNPDCIWYLKKGIACTYKAWVIPTAKPTPRPTFAPVISYEFYNVPSTGVCAFNDEAKPAWISKIYTDWDECCRNESWDVPKCLAAKPEMLNEANQMQQHSSSTGSDDYVIIDITMYGSLRLDKLILPSVTSQEWNDLKRVLTKSIILTLAYDSGLVHPNVEVELWSLGNQEFTWRRLLTGDEFKLQDEISSSLRGTQGERRARKNKKTKKPSSKPTQNDMVQNSESLGSSYDLKFAAVIPTKCDHSCQSSSYLGQVEADLIEVHLQDFVKNNYFGVQLKREGNAVGLFLDSLPKASGVSLEYRFASKSGGGLTWTPSASPTYRPTWPPTPSPSFTVSPSISSRPTGRTYYPDYENHICKVADGTESEFEVNFFPSLKECCKFDWIDYKTCMKLSFTDSPTSKPTGKPSSKPTKGPKTKRPTLKPSVKPSPAPTSQPINLNSSPAGSAGGAVYYPDLYEGVCKSDGKHGSIPYTFSTPEACCNNNYMDYKKCMAHANPKTYFPNPWVGFCQESDGTENTMYLYSSAKECCETGMVGEYDACLSNTLSQSGPEPTKHPTRSPIVSSLPGNYYPDFTAGFCRSDGLHGDRPFVFASAEKCCKNQIMNYAECLSESINRYQEAPPTTPKPTNMPTKKPTTPKPSNVPTKKPTFPKPTNMPTKKSTVLSVPGHYYPDFTAGYCRSDGMHQDKPLVFTKAEKCCDNDLMNYDSCLSLSIQNFVPTTTTTTMPAKVYYPDLAHKVCKSDGNHVTSPYVFSSAQSCCENNYMDYDRCMAYAAGYTYIPNPSEGYCRVSSGTDMVAYKYNSPEDCCDSGIFDDANGCLSLSIERLGGPGGNSNPVSSTTTTSTTTTSAARVYYPDLVLKVCKSDGKQGQIPYLFNTAHSCCDNAYMDYEVCMKYAVGNTSVVLPTTTTTATTTTATTSQATKVFYPDLVLKVCKSDGKQGNLPFLFNTAHECCDHHTFMNYDVCMDYAYGNTSSGLSTTTSTSQAAKIFYPDLDHKVCKSDGKQGNIPFLFNTAHECCDNNLMDYALCMAYANGDLSASEISTTTATTSSTDISPATPISTPAPITQQPTLKPTQKPTDKFTTPPVVEAAIDARKFTDEVTDGFEHGLGGVFPWSTTPDKPWTIDKTTFKDGTASARSALISKGETSDLYVAVNSEHGGTFFFSLKSDVQMPYSGFYVNIDDKSKMGYTFSFSEWRDLTVNVDAGQHVLMFRTWVPSIASGASTTTSGTVYVDNVSFQPILIENFEKETLAWPAAEFVDNMWIYDTSNSHGGIKSLRSPSLSSGDSATLSFEFTTSSKGFTVEFWYDSKLNGGDKFEFKIDGYTVLEKSTGGGNWFMQSKSLIPGTHKLEWKFIKSGGAADSTVWIDDIRIRPIGA